LDHIEVGSIFMSTIGTLGPIVIGAIIGGVIGGTFGSPFGGIAGTIIGGFIGAALQFGSNFVFEDESSSMWTWLSASFVSASENVPWYIPFFGGPNADLVYLLVYINELRVGNTWFVNNNGLSGP
jgi:hypothetical protein